MKRYFNVPVFQYGLNQNRVMIPREVIEPMLDSFKSVPIIDYRVNPAGIVVGAVSQATDIDDTYVYADIFMYYTNHRNVAGFYNYEIIPEETHQEGDVTVIDKCKISAISLNFDD